MIGYPQISETDLLLAAKRLHLQNDDTTKKLKKEKDSWCKCSFEPCQTKARNKAVITVEASGHGTHQQLHIFQKSSLQTKGNNLLYIPINDQGHKYGPNK